jgi:SAM-dependent methyltransferase
MSYFQQRQTKRNSSDLPRKIKLVKDWLDDIEIADYRVLDIGGIPRLYDYMASVFDKGEVYLLNNDINNAENAELFIGDATNLPFKDESFDFVTAFDLIEHLARPDDLLSESFRLLKVGGFFIVSTPNLASYLNRLVLLLGFSPYQYTPSRYRVGEVFTTSKSGYGHVSVFTYNGLKELLAIHRFRTVKSCGFSYTDKFYFELDPSKADREVGFYEIRNAISKLLPKSMREGMLFICRKDE